MINKAYAYNNEDGGNGYWFIFVEAHGVSGSTGGDESGNATLPINPYSFPI